MFTENTRTGFVPSSSEGCTNVEEDTRGTARREAADSTDAGMTGGTDAVVKAGIPRGVVEVQPPSEGSGAGGGITGDARMGGGNEAEAQADFPRGAVWAERALKGRFAEGGITGM